MSEKTELNHMLRLVVWILASVIVTVGAEPSRIPDSSETNQRNKDTVFSYLLPVVNSCRKPVRIYYRMMCQSGESPAFPSVAVQPPGKGKTGLAAVREIFAKDKNVRVTEDGGVIRIWIGKMPTAILQTKLGRLALDPKARYNPDVALSAMEKSKEMQAAEQALNYTPPSISSGSFIDPNEKLPHLPATIRNATAEQVLDKVAKTWAGDVIVIYGACPEKNKDGEILFVFEWTGQVG
jgi:hypothetical protein